MEAVKEMTHKERILRALSQIPIASTAQLATLFTNGSPLKRASEHLNELLGQKLIEFSWHQRGKVWKLTSKYLKMTNGSRLPCEHIDHALAVAEVYFTLSPFQWLYEYKKRFTFEGESYVWNPDAVLAYTTKDNKKAPICIEVQRTPLSEKQWKAKFSIYNKFFVEAYKEAEFQKWKSKGDPIIPQVVVITSQKNVTGLNISKELKVISNIAELV